MQEEEIKKSVDAAQKFFRANSRQFLEAMQDAEGSRYPPRYEGEAEVIQALRDISHLIDNDYADMSVGGTKFSSPEALMRSLQGLKDLAAAHYSKVLQIKNHLGHGTDSIDNALDMCIHTRDSLDYALSLYNPIPVHKKTAIDEAIRLASRLPHVHRQLQKRHSARNTLKIIDEYDVQDLLHTILKISFDDIRPEESAPSFAGLTHRVDLLLFQEKVMIEVKYARANNAQKDIAHQLLIDIAAYKTHPRADRLLCVIWDEVHHLKNPNALKSDIEGSSNGYATVLVLS